MPDKTKGTVRKKKGASKGESMVCEVCGLSVVVERIGGVTASEKTTLLCCGNPMKARRAPANTAKQ